MMDDMLTTIYSMQIARGGRIRWENKIMPSQINKKDKNNLKINGKDKKWEQHLGFQRGPPP